MRPSLLLLLTAGLLFGVRPAQGQDRMANRIIDFGGGYEGEWMVVNDGVMGGVSRSTIRRGEEGGTAVFEGVLSLENNGGFASVRSPIPGGSLDGVSVIRLRVRGDGQRYQLRLRRGRSWDGVAFAASFETRAGEWIEVELPIEDFQPSFRGYRPRVPPLDPADVGQLSIMLTDKQEGPFRMEIAWIEAVTG